MGLPIRRARGIRAGDWVRISTPNGAVRARAKLNGSLDPLRASLCDVAPG